MGSQDGLSLIPNDGIHPQKPVEPLKKDKGKLPEQEVAKEVFKAEKPSEAKRLDSSRFSQTSNREEIDSKANEAQLLDEVKSQKTFLESIGNKKAAAEELKKSNAPRYLFWEDDKGKMMISVRNQKGEVHDFQIRAGKNQFWLENSLDKTLMPFQTLVNRALVKAEDVIASVEEELLLVFDGEEIPNDDEMEAAGIYKRGMTVEQAKAEVLKPGGHRFLFIGDEEASTVIFRNSKGVQQSNDLQHVDPDDVDQMGDLIDDLSEDLNEVIQFRRSQVQPRQEALSDLEKDIETVKRIAQSSLGKNEAMKISRQKWNLKHSYTVIHDQDGLQIYRHIHGRVKGFFKSIFAKFGFVNKGTFKNIFDVVNVTGGRETVRARLVKKPMQKNTLEFLKEFAGSNSILIPKHVVWKSWKTGETKEALIMPKMATDALDFSELKSVSLDIRKNVIKKMALSIQEIHAKNWVHRDLKPENFLIDGDDVRLIDLDFVDKITDADQVFVNRIGTWAYMAPELKGKNNIRGEVVKKADIYSLGVTFYSMLHPQNDAGRIKIQKEPVDKTSYEYLIWKMIRDNPKDRPSMDQVVRFLNGDFTALQPIKSTTSSVSSVIFPPLDTIKNMNQLRSSNFWCNTVEEAEQLLLNSRETIFSLAPSNDGDPNKAVLIIKDPTRKIIQVPIFFHEGQFEIITQNFPISGDFKNVVINLFKHIGYELDE